MKKKLYAVMALVLVCLLTGCGDTVIYMYGDSSTEVNRDPGKLIQPGTHTPVISEEFEASEEVEENGETAESEEPIESQETMEPEIIYTEVPNPSISFLPSTETEESSTSQAPVQDVKVRLASGPFISPMVSLDVEGYYESDYYAEVIKQFMALGEKDGITYYDGHFYNSQEFMYSELGIETYSLMATVDSGPKIPIKYTSFITGDGREFIVHETYDHGCMFVLVDDPDHDYAYIYQCNEGLTLPEEYSIGWGYRSW